MNPTAADTAEAIGTAPSPAEPPHSVSSIRLPDHPVAVIHPGQSWGSFDAGVLWAYRELLYFLTWRDIKVRYKQTLLGAGWAVLQPVLSMVIFSLLFGRLARLPSDGIPYPVFAYAGLLPWIFFSNGVATSANSLVNSAHIIRKVYFPRMMLPAASVTAGLVDTALGLFVLFGLMGWYGIAPKASWLLLPALTGYLAILTLAVGLGLSALNVRYRDVRHAMPFIVQIWLFVTPVIYPSSILPGPWRWVLALNPMSGVIEAFRAALFGTPFNVGLLAISAIVTVIVMVLSARTFHRLERSFADVV